MSDVLNYLFCEVTERRQRTRRSESTPDDRIVECRAIAARAERLAASAPTDGKRYLELAEQWRALADEMAPPSR